jgi:hypothetical protein
MIPFKVGRGFVIFVVLLACAGRLVYLDADPSFPTWIGYIVDEGRWNETARNLALFRDPDLNWFSQLHLFISPGYQAINYIVFLAFGVDYWSARVFGAVAGILILLIVFFTLRRHVSALALAFGVVTLGLETNVFWASRIALPEMPALLATLVAFLLLVLGRATPWNAGVAGLLAVVAVAMKGTTVLALLIFPVIALIVPLGTPVRTRIMRAIAFVASFAVSVVAAVVAMSLLGYLKADAAGDIAGRFVDFLSWTSAYLAVSRFFDATELEARNLLLLGIWFCSWLWVYRRPRAPWRATELYLAAGLWAGWWLLVWSANTYLPGRYQVHFVVPATLHIMAGLSLGDRDTVARVVTNFAQRTGPRRATTVCWLVLPSAIVIASVVAGLAGLMGWEADRLLERSAIVAAVTGFLTLFVSLRPINERSIVGFLTFPIATALLWLVARELGMLSRFWMFDSDVNATMWGVSVGAPFVLCFTLTSQIHARRALIGGTGIALLMVIFLAQSAPPILNPTYSLRDTSRDLKQHLPVDQPVRTVMAASLFLENGIKYHELPRDDKSIDGLVIFDHGGLARRFVSTEPLTNLVRVHAYPLTVSPRYQTSDGSRETPFIYVYRRRDNAAQH